jgi:hypothetical protein
MNIDEAVKRACEEPTLLDALSWICVWDSERAIKQALTNYGSGTDGAGWDTCFKFCLKRVLDEYPADKMNHGPDCEADPQYKAVCEGIYAEKCDDVLKLQEALRAVYALAGEDKEIAKIVHEAIAETGGES